MIAALLFATASAAPSVVDLSEPLDLDVPGRHARPFVNTAGEWRIGFGRSGSFHSVPWDGVTADREAQITHVMLGTGVDHGFVPCPDGGFLHVASSHGAALDDTATATRLDAGLMLVAQRDIVTGSETLATNDMAVVCSEVVEGAAFAERGEEGEGEFDGDTLFRLDGDFFDGGVPVQVDISESTRVTGNSLVWDAAGSRLLSIGLERDLGMQVSAWDADLGFLSTTAVPGPEAPLVGWWAQGAVPVDDHWLVVHMQGDPEAGWGLDTGDVALVLLDSDFAVVERHPLTALTPPNGAMRPSLALRGDELLVTFDVGGAITAVTGRIARPDPGGDGADGSDGAGAGSDGETDGASGDADGLSGDTGAAGSAASAGASRCGCAGGAAGALWLSMGLAWARRRRPGHA